MPHVPPALARRLDRLARRAHAFHRFAHHPLCGAYAGEVLRVGRRARACRGCASAAAGALGGALLGALLPSPPPLAFAAGLVLAAAVPILAVRPVHPAPRRRPGKLVTRALPCLVLSALATAGLGAWSAPGAAACAGALALGAVTVARYRRRGPDRAPCAGCPERALAVPCAGLRPLARREAAFGRLAGRLLRSLGPGPGRRRPGYM